MQIVEKDKTEERIRKKNYRRKSILTFTILNNTCLHTYVLPKLHGDEEKMLEHRETSMNVLEQEKILKTSKGIPMRKFRVKSRKGF